MGWSQTSRVILVWPARGQPLDRQLDLVLLLRHSHSLGVQICLVTHDTDIRDQARSLGIPVFRSVSQAQKSHWRKSRRYRLDKPASEFSDAEHLSRIENLLSNPIHRERENPRYSPNQRIIIFSLGVLAVLAIAAVLLPSAEITLNPDRKHQSVTIDVQASPEFEEVSLNGTFPERRISTIVEGRASIPTTGSVNVPTSFASGEVEFHNLTDRAIMIPQGTVVSSSEDGFKYRTQQAARIADAPDAAILVPVEALLPGSASNLPEGKIDIIEGQLGILLTVENPARISGGSDTTSPAPADSDRTQLRKRLISILQSSALREINSSLVDGDFLLLETPSLTEVVTEEYFPAEMEPANELNLTLRLEFNAPYISFADQEVLAKSILDSILAEGYEPIPGTLTIKHISSPAYDEGETTSWQMQLSRTIRSQLAASQAISLALGRSPREASQQLFNNLPLSEPPKIITRPSWWPVLPLVPLRIEVTTSEQDQENAKILSQFQD